MDEVLQVSRAFLESVFGGEIGSERFVIMLSAPLFGAFVVAWFLSKAFGSKKGMVGALIALVLPLVIGVAGYSLASVFVVPEINQAWATDYLGWAVFALVALLTVIVLSRRVWDIGAIAAVIVIVLALSAGSIGYMMIDSMMDLSDQADDTATGRKQILEDAGK